MGSTIAFSIGVYVQQEFGFALGYTIPAVSIFASIIILLIGRTWYILKLPEGKEQTRASNKQKVSIPIGPPVLGPSNGQKLLF